MEEPSFDLLGGAVERITYLPKRSGLDLNYYDFPLCHDAFATGQSDARPLLEKGCFWRVRGRKSLSYTLIAFDDAAEAWKQLQEKISSGAKVGTLNYTYERPKDIPTQNGPTEFFVEKFSTILKNDGYPASKLRNAWVEGLETREPTEAEAQTIFDGWVEWAGDRHFMVFKGHYLSWMRLHYTGAGSSKLIGFFREGKPVGMIGYEEYNGVKAVILAKHLSELKPNVLWALGLRDAGEGLVLCGSTADTFKSRFGMSQRESWTFKKAGLSEPE